MSAQSQNRRTLILCLILLAVFGVAFLLYRLPPVLAGGTETPPWAYFNQLAQSFLHGRLDLANPPMPPVDLTPHDGKWYVPFPPLSAILMIPWAAALGDVETVLFAGLMGALNAALVFLMLQGFAAQQWISLPQKNAFWLTALFAFGTVHWYISTQGSVWFVAHLCTVTFIALAVFLAVYFNAPLPAGIALGLAMLGRPNLFLTYPLLFGIAVQHAQESGIADKRRYLLRWAILSAIPVFVAGGLLLLYNQLRFGNPLDFGYMAAQVDPRVAADLHTHGQFSPAYVWRNIKVMLFSLPMWNEAQGKITPSGEGLSLFLTTPAFLFMFKPIRKSPILIGAWASLGLLLIPLLTYFNTGWYQFGYRFSLDFIIPLMVLLAFAVGERMPRLFPWFVLASILVNAWGTAWFLGLL
ncbi:MAG: hypothetical protein JW929_12905 [Anaerolineales bacterium]|nr:hypothetical protein [Anaerolineales bacterium]